MLSELKEINLKTCQLLWELPDVKASNQTIDYPRLIIPEKRSKDPRISEQEARFVYSSVLNNSRFYYSIETPTEKEYTISGKGKRSASTDLTIYEYDGEFKKLVNVEFKAHNAKFEEIEKDIRKLINEEKIGNWFHLLKNTNSKTLKALFEKVKKALVEDYDKKISKISILFCFCILDKKWACMKHFYWDSSTSVEYKYYVEDFFGLDYIVRKGKIVVMDENGWEIVQF